MSRSVILIALLKVLLLPPSCAQAQSDSVQTDTAQQKGRIFPSPLLGYTPETRWYFGAGMIWYLPPSKKYPLSNASVMKFVGVYTLNKQIESNLSGESWMRNNVYKLEYSASFYQFPDAFFGIGNYTDVDDRESYGFDFYNTQIHMQRKIIPFFFGGVKLFVEHTSVYDVVENGILDTQEIPGEEGGWNTGLGPWITYDTRDNIYYPMRGVLADVSAVAHAGFLGSEYNYMHYEVEVSHYDRIMDDDVLALNYYGEFVPGDPPFNRMAELGGDKQMRGHFEGRYRDINYMTLQAEYRITFWKYAGIHVFGGIGQVAETFNDFSLNGLRYSYGAGGRLFIVPEDKVSLRVDYGFDGEGNGGLYVTFREAF